MSLGICCQYKELSEKGIVNLCDEKHLLFGQFQNGKYSNIRIEQTWEHNSISLLNIIKRIHNEKVKVFRISCGIFPLYDCVSHLLYNSQSIKDVLKDIGSFIKTSGIRLTIHPDQFVVLSSNRPEVIAKSKNILQHYGWVFDQIGLNQNPFNPINIHGGVRNNHNILIDSIKTLPIEVKSRLTLENDESSYNVLDLYKIYEETGVPICWDSHHHSFNNASLSNEEALDISKNTWDIVKPI